MLIPFCGGATKEVGANRILLRVACDRVLVPEATDKIGPKHGNESVIAFLNVSFTTPYMIGLIAELRHVMKWEKYLDNGYHDGNSITS